MNNTRVTLSAWSFRADTGEPLAEWTDAFEKKMRYDLLQKLSGNVALADAINSRVDLDRELAMKTADVVGEAVVAAVTGIADRHKSHPLTIQAVNGRFAFEFTGASQVFCRLTDLVSELAPQPKEWGDLNSTSGGREIVERATPEIVRYGAFFAQSELRQSVLDGTADDPQSNPATIHSLSLSATGRSPAASPSGPWRFF